MPFPFDLRNPSLADLLKLLPMVGPVVAATKEFADRFEVLIASRGAGEQAELRKALEDIRADNDEGHARLQEKLRRAAQE